MFRNYLKIALRNIFKHKIFSLINISGLSIGLTCCLLIIVYVRDELSFDTYHDNIDNIYRIACEYKSKDHTVRDAGTPGPLARELRTSFPEIIGTVRFWRNLSFKSVMISSGDRHSYEGRFFFADHEVFNVFTFPLIKGDPETALKDPYSIVITRSMAEKYFGNQNPLGKTLRVNLEDEYIFTITGVVDNVPYNSHFRFDFLASMESLKDLAGYDLENWRRATFFTYILLPEGSNPEQLEKRISGFIQPFFEESEESRMTVFLQPLNDIHLKSHLEGELETNSHMANIYIFIAIAVFILFIACINFMNLSTALSVDRSIEIGMRKVLGAQRMHIIRQFLAESLIVACISMAVAVSLTELFLPAFNSIAEKELIFDYYKNVHFVAGIILITVIVGIVSGSYPAFYLSTFVPADVLKGTAKPDSKTRLRKSLVVVQFAISIILIIGTGIVGKQLRYVKNMNLGFTDEHIVVFPLLSRELQQKYEAIKEDLLKNPSILCASASSTIPGGNDVILEMRQVDTENSEITALHTLFVDYDFIETFGLDIVEGRNFSGEVDGDTGQVFILNEAASKQFGGEASIGKRLSHGIHLSGTVIGIVKDFHFRSLHEKVEPLLLFFSPRWFQYVSVRIRSENISGTMAFMENVWHTYDQNYPFEYTFIDEYFNRQYRADERLGDIFRYFSILSICIACLGLFGLVSFAAVQRTKEIAIRKVLGASVSGIVLFFSKEFTILVILANIIAWPVALFAMHKWLDNFAYQVNMGIVIFILGGLIALVAAFLTVSLRALKAALANPADALK